MFYKITRAMAKLICYLAWYIVIVVGVGKVLLQLKFKSILIVV